MVWLIDAQKGRFPSKNRERDRMAHGRANLGDPIYLSNSQTPTSHAPHMQTRCSAASHCRVPTAASRQWALQPRRLLLTPFADL